MNILNDEFAIVSPIRCGTRWIVGLLWDYLGVDWSKKSPTHSFDLDIMEDRKVIFIVRNPYKRLRSIFRWEKDIGTIPLDYSWDDFVLNNTYSPIYDSYEDKLSKVHKFVKLENINKEVKNIFNIDLPTYNNEYFDNHVDDGITFEKAYSNPEYVKRVNKQFKNDFIHFQYEMLI